MIPFRVRHGIVLDQLICVLVDLPCFTKGQSPLDFGNKDLFQTSNVNALQGVSSCRVTIALVVAKERFPNNCFGKLDDQIHCQFQQFTSSKLLQMHKVSVNSVWAGGWMSLRKVKTLRDAASFCRCWSRSQTRIISCLSLCLAPLPWAVCKNEEVKVAKGSGPSSKTHVRCQQAANNPPREQQSTADQQS